MKKLAIQMGLVSVVFVVLVVIFSTMIGNRIEGEVGKIETKVGQKLILQKIH